MTALSPSHDRLPSPQTSSDPHTLVARWLFSARQSLSSVSLCSRANSLVTSARKSLTSSFSLSARVVFVAAALRDQLKVSRDVYQAFRGTEQACRERFQETLGRLDEADRKLNLVLEGLKTIKLDPVFGAEGEQKRLVDFVDAEGVEGLKSGLRNCIDQVQESHEAFLKTIEELETDISTFDARLKPLSIPVLTPAENPITDLIATLEDHAESMANLMQSLTDHYDNCRIALRDLDTTSPTPDDPTPHDDMLRILAKDSAEVADVIDEMKERLSTLEDLVSSQLEPQMRALESADDAMLQSFLAFQRFQEKLALYLAAMTEFECKQDECSGKMDEKLAEMIALEEFYTGFRGAYEAMFGEVRRRETRLEEMRRVAREAETRIQRIWEEDRNEREGFRREMGEYLPLDIWPGLMDSSPRFEIVEVEGDMENSKEEEAEEMTGTMRNGVGGMPL